ncbi:MAG: transglutaminase-like cysteine peptidase [Phyllobacteriaceae bacterium]|nr:transglutaminase-like cysteine peptidase [Phyllobacteriaceae bacterium]
MSALTLISGLAASAPAAATPFMQLSGDTTQPIGHYELCQRLPSECRALRANVKPTRLTQSLWSRIIDINTSVNAMIRPLTDLEMWGVEEIWSYPTVSGDCEDYVLLKRRLLIQAGIAEANLLITVVRQADGSGHAVLTVVTSQGEYVLDNLRGEVRAWNETGYTFLKRQSASHSGRWIGISDRSGNPAVAALK